MEQARYEFNATPLAADDPRFLAAMDLQIAQMRRVLDLMAPSASQDAFRALNEIAPQDWEDAPRYAAQGRD